MYVRYQGCERLLRLVHVEGQWHGGLLVPGKEDLLAGHVPPCPEGSVLPEVDFPQDMTVRVATRVQGLSCLSALRLLVATGASLEQDHVVVPLRSLITEYHDRLAESPEPPRTQATPAQILKLPASRRRRPGQDIDLER